MRPAIYIPSKQLRQSSLLVPIGEGNHAAFIFVLAIVSGCCSGLYRLYTNAGSGHGPGRGGLTRYFKCSFCTTLAVKERKQAFANGQNPNNTIVYKPKIKVKGVFVYFPGVDYISRDCR